MRYQRPKYRSWISWYLYHKMKTTSIQTYTVNPPTHTIIYSTPPVTHGHAIPYSQFLRIRRICNDEHIFIKRAQQMEAHFFRRRYDHDNIHTSIIKAWRTDRDSLLQPQTTNSTDTDNPLLLITTDNQLYRHWQPTAPNNHRQPTLQTLTTHCS